MKFLIKISWYICLLFVVVPIGAFAIVGDGNPAPNSLLGIPPFLRPADSVIGPPGGNPISDDATAARARAGDTGYSSSSDSGTQLVPCSLCTLKQIITMGVKIYNYLTGFGAILAVAAIVWGGFSYITAAGDTGKMGAAKEVIYNAIIGIVVLAASALIVNTVINWISKGEGLKGNGTPINKVEDVKAQ